MTQENERAWAVLCHLGTLAGGMLPLGHLLVPLCIWLYYRRSSAYIDAHGRSSLDFQLSITLWFAFLAATMWGLGKVLGDSNVHVVVVSALMALLALTGLLLVIQASRVAYHGETFRYPLSFRLLTRRDD